MMPQRLQLLFPEIFRAWCEIAIYFGHGRLGSIQNMNNWNNVSKRLFGSYSHYRIPGFPFWLFCSQEQNSQNIFQNIFLFRNIPNECALSVQRKTYTLSKSLWLANHADELVIAVLYLPARQLGRCFLMKFKSVTGVL